jgi:tetratricopeptide (TPR) repeat protein
LKSEPVLACPPSAAYRFRKLARRNKAAFATASALILAALLAVVGLAASNRLITREKEEKEAALTRALQEKERADQNLARARDAVKQYLLKTNDNPLLQTGDFQGLRKELLETAVAFYEEFVRQDQQNPDLELERGRAYDDLGFLRQGIGDEERALSDFEQAKGVFRRLAATYPDRPVYRLRLAEGYNSRGAVLKDHSRSDPAEQEFRQALGLVDQLLLENPSATEYVETQARIQSNLGTLLKEFGRVPEAESLLRQAVASREKLLEQKPASLPLRGQLATSWLNLGTVLHAQRKAVEAERAFEKILEILDPDAVKQATHGAPESPKYQHQRANAWNNLGMMRNAAGLHAKAEEAFRQALAIKEKLADTFPSVPQYRPSAGLSTTCSVLGSANRMDEAQTGCTKCHQLYERLVADSPAVPQYIVSLAGAYSNMGRLIGDQGQLEKSLPWLAKSVEILDGALRRNPRVAQVRDTLCVASWTRAMTLSGLSRYSEAMVDWDRAIEMDGGRYQQQLRLRRASNLLNLKDDIRATADAAAVAESPTATAEDLYNAACIYSLSAQLATDDASRAESYAGHAVKLLRQAAAKGFKDAEHVKTDSDLDGLRSRGDFQQFSKELDARSSQEKSPGQE